MRKVSGILFKLSSHVIKEKKCLLFYMIYSRKHCAELRNIERGKKIINPPRYDVQLLNMLLKWDCLWGETLYIDLNFVQNDGCTETQWTWYKFRSIMQVMMIRILFV